MNKIDRANDPEAYSYEHKSREVRRMVNDLMEYYGLAEQGWTYRENPIAKRFLGVCCYTDRRIEVSREAIKRNSLTSLFNTCTHEVAHALAGHEEGHGPRWQEIHRQMGGTGERCGSYESGKPGRYEAVADCGASCGWRWRMGAAMKRNRMYHSECGPDCRITWVDHGSEG